MPGLTPPEQPKPGELFGTLRKRYEPVRSVVKNAVAAGLPGDVRSLRRGAFLAAEQLNPMVYKDSLTGLNNKRWFDDEVKRKTAEANRNGKPLWILTLDIDDFKKFNSQYGHQGGDTALKAIAKLPFREEEPIARIGGDEFSELLDEEITEEQIVLVVKRHIEQMRVISQSLNLKPITKIADDELAREITLTFGLTKYQKDESTEEFERRANLAMHEAKNRGKNRIIIAEKTEDPEKPAYRDLEL